MPIDLLRGALALPTPPTEDVATPAVARAASNAGCKVWSAEFEGEVKHLGKYDVSWGPAGAPRPTVLTQMKTGGVHQEDQSVLEFLNDVLFAAFDRAYSGEKGTFLCCAVLHPGEKNRLHWPLLKALDGDALLEITPCKAVVERAPAPHTWIDAAAKTLRPRTRTQLAQIFSGTQKMKFVGLFQRPGTLRIPLTARAIPVGQPEGAFDLLAWEVGEPALADTSLSLDQWMP